MRYWYRIRSIWRSRDNSTPETPRRDGTYGWPKAYKSDIVAIVDGNLNPINRT